VESRSLAAVLARRWPLVVAPIAFAVAVVVFGSLAQTTTYEATSTVRVTSRAALLGSTVRPDDLEYLDRLYNTYERVATTDEMLDRLRERYDIVGDIDVWVQARPRTELMDVRVNARDADTAVRAANGLAGLLVSRVDQLSNAGIESVDRVFERRLGRLERQLGQLRAERANGAARGASLATLAQLDARIRVLETAIVQLRFSFEENRLARQVQGQTVAVLEPAATADEVSRALVGKIALAAVLAGLAGVGLALLFDRLRRVPSTVDELEQGLGVPVVGRVPRDTGLAGARDRLATTPAVLDAFHRLSTVLALHNPEGDTSSIAITSAARGDGKSTVAAYLARAVANSGKSVLLIDGDFRAPRLHQIFGVPNASGLKDLLATDRAPLRRLVHATDVPGLSILTNGPSGQGRAGLTGPALRELLASAKAEFDVVLVDTSALLGDADSLTVSAAADAVLLVATEARTRWSALEQAVDQLQKVHAHVLGVVANGWDDGVHRMYEPAPNGDAAPAQRPTTVVLHADPLLEPKPAARRSRRPATITPGDPSKSRRSP
jgi:capsular exopolysaccharide synthesis family protein